MFRFYFTRQIIFSFKMRCFICNRDIFQSSVRFHICCRSHAFDLSLGTLVTFEFCLCAYIAVGGFEIKGVLIFSRAVLCCLTWNSLGTEVSCVRRADDVQTTRGRRADDTRVRLCWRFQVADDICRPDVIRTSSTGRYVICMLSAHAHVIRISSASHPHHSSWSA